MFSIYSSQVNGVRSRVRPAMTHSISFPGTYLFFQTLDFSNSSCKILYRNDKAITENNENDSLYSFQLKVSLIKIIYCCVLIACASPAHRRKTTNKVFER